MVWPYCITSRDVKEAQIFKPLLPWLSGDVLCGNGVAQEGRSDRVSMAQEPDDGGNIMAANSNIYIHGVI